MTTVLDILDLIDMYVALFLLSVLAALKNRNLLFAKMMIAILRDPVLFAMVKKQRKENRLRSNKEKAERLNEAMKSFDELVEYTK